MASLLEPGDVQLGELACYLKYALQVLEEETLKQVRTNLTMVKTNRVECEGLANVYQAGVEKIATLVPMVLQWREGPSMVEPIEEVGSLSWLLLSLAEIERCMESGGCYILSCAELLDSDIGSISVSRMISSLVREFSFSLDLVQVAFNFLMCKHRRRDPECLESSYDWRDLAAELLVYCPRSEFFEWCERRCRPVLKQFLLDLGQEMWQFSALVGEVAYNDQGHLGHPGNSCKSDLASALEELPVQPGDSLPLRIDHQDVQDQKYLGHGSLGTVFTCKWHDKDMVVKTIRLDPGHLQCEEAFEREVSILASLHHPNAVQTFGFGYTEGRAEGFYVMEQMETDLSTIIKEKRSLSGESLVFPIDVSMDVMSQIVEGLCALRLEGVIHRDLKPTNILVSRPDESMKPFERFYRVKLADFGTSKVRDGGSPAYMAPEVMAATLLPEESGEHGYSWKADVYSFGLVCSEILTGVVPFQNYKGHIGNTLAAVRGGERPDLPLDAGDPLRWLTDAGDPLRRLIEDCWKVNAEERPDVWEVRQRLWECRVFHFFRMEKPSTSWQTFCFRLDSRRANVNGSETSSGVGSSSPISGSKEREQAPVLLNSSRGALQVTELMENVINIAQSARESGCSHECFDLAHSLSGFKTHIESMMTSSDLTKSQIQRMCLADVDRLRTCITEIGESIRAVACFFCKVGVGAHHCQQISIATCGLLELFSSEALYDITQIVVGRQGPVVMPTREQVSAAVVMPTPDQISAALDRIQFNPFDIHIAVCGTSGSGISSFVNAFCGLGDKDDEDNEDDEDDEDYGAARVGVTQCTSEITRYYVKSQSDVHLPALPGLVLVYDVPGAGTMAYPEGQYFNDQGLFIFDAIILVYDARFSRIDVEIIKSSLRFNVPVFIVRNKADQHIANMMRVESGVEPGDNKGPYNKVYQEVVEKYVQASRSEFEGVMAAMATDPEMDLRDQELLLLKQRFYVVSSKSSKSESWSFPVLDSPIMSVNKRRLFAHVWAYFSHLKPMLGRVSHGEG